MCPKRKRIAILASTLALATTGAAALVVVTAPAASASTQVASDIVSALGHHVAWDRIQLQHPGKVVQVGLLPYGADSTHGCAFGLLSTWYTHGAFRFQVENSSADEHTCSADVVAAYVTPFRTWSTGSLLPGRSRGWTWNNAADFRLSGRAGRTGCGRLLVAGQPYVLSGGGEREFGAVCPQQRIGRMHGHGAVGPRGIESYVVGYYPRGWGDEGRVRHRLRRQ